MRPRPRILVAACSVTLLFAAPKDVSIETIESVKRTVVPIVCGIDNGENNLTVVRVLGSGFLINRQGDFLTAAHVLTGWQNVSTKEHPCVACVYFPIGGWRSGAQGVAIQGNARARWFLFMSCVANSKIDIASCRMTENPFTNPEVKDQVFSVTFDNAELPDGTAVAFTGFPLNSMRPITSKGFVAGYRNDTDTGLPEVILDKAAWTGASGSPLYTADGTVIGVLRETGVQEGAGLAYARVSSLITNFLKDNKISFSEATRR